MKTKNHTHLTPTLNPIGKCALVIGLFVVTAMTNMVFAQKIPQSQVPSLIVNQFQQSFPKATDVEWKLKGEVYEVEFEIGLPGTDHEAWYDKTGKLIRNEEEIAQSGLPQKVLDKITRDFSGFRTDDIEKITEGEKVTYQLELKSLTEEWKVVFDSEGNMLSKVVD